MLKLIGKIKCLLGFHEGEYIMYTPDGDECCVRCGKYIRSLK